MYPNTGCDLSLFVWPTMYMDAFQRMNDLQQQSARAEGQIQRHVSRDGGLRSG